MPLPSTMTPIATNTFTSAASTLTFSNIPQGYTDLVIIANYANSGGQSDSYLRFNGDSGTNYSKTQLYGTGSAAGSNNQANFSNFGGFGYVGTTLSNTVCNIMNYSNSTTYKTVIVRSNDTAGLTMANVGLWRSTAAITSIVIGFANNNFISGSTFTLYGVKAA
jgi:hypothetical protein